MMTRKGRSSSGFTLLEVIIAMAIMVVSFAAILAVQGGSMAATTRAKQMNIVGMLARNQMVETEFKIQGKKLDEARKEESGTFPPPYDEYAWKTEIKELKFPRLPFGNGDSNSQGAEAAEMLTKLVTNYLSKSLREVTVTVMWKKGGHPQTFSLSTFWVDLNHDFSLSE